MISIDDADLSYRQIVIEQDQDSLKIRVDSSSLTRFDLISLLFLLLLLSSSEALPIVQTYSGKISSDQRSIIVFVFVRLGRILPPPRYPSVYPMQASYANGAQVQINDRHQVKLPSLQEEQYRRERQRRMMIEKLFHLFDEDGNGQLTNDELYSMALRSNIFPKIHSYLKQSTI